MPLTAKTIVSVIDWLSETRKSQMTLESPYHVEKSSATSVPHSFEKSITDPTLAHQIQFHPQPQPQPQPEPVFVNPPSPQNELLAAMNSVPAFMDMPPQKTTMPVPEVPVAQATITQSSIDNNSDLSLLPSSMRADILGEEEPQAQMNDYSLLPTGWGEGNE